MFIGIVGLVVVVALAVFTGYRLIRSWRTFGERSGGGRAPRP